MTAHSNSPIKNGTRQFWQQHVDNFKRSNMTQKVFCKKYNIYYPRFRYWYYKLKDEEKSSEQAKLVPIKEKILPSLPILCTLILPNGNRLLIHDASLVDKFFEGAH